MFAFLTASPIRLGILLALLFCLMAASPALAAAGPPTLFGFSLHELIHTRTGIIQLSIVCVIAGICILIKR
jgi:hypothetical protein